MRSVILSTDGTQEVGYFSYRWSQSPRLPTAMPAKLVTLKTLETRQTFIQKVTQES